MGSVEKAICLIAAAYGTGPLAGIRTMPERYWSPACRVTGDGDESNPAASAGLLVARPTETIERAGRAINPKDPKQAKWLATMPPETRNAVHAWNEANSVRQSGRGVSYRVSEHVHWKRTVGTMVVPETRPTHGPMVALADAQLDGPLEGWLILAATMQVERWPDVRRFVVACGHPGWAADEAARRIIARADPLRARAKLYGIRAETFGREVRSADCRLQGWLSEAARRFLDAYENPPDRMVNHGEANACRAETWWRPLKAS